jgi:hypothetical protein
VRAQDDVGGESRDLVAQLAGVELLDRALQPADERAARRTIRRRIQPGPQLRGLLDELDVLLAVEPAEVLRNPREEIDVGGVDGRIGGAGRRFERLRGAHVAGAGGDTEDEEARVAWHARILAEARAVMRAYHAMIFGESRSLTMSA